MELRSKLLEQVAFIEKPKIEKHMSFVMDTQDGNLFQPLQTNNKQFVIAVTLLTGYYGIFNVTNQNINFYFSISITRNGFQ